MHRLRFVRIAGLVALMTLCVLPSIICHRSTSAATCVVNPVVINNADSGGGSLRQAILDACDGSTITFANTVASPITLASELAIDKNLTIQGPGAGALTISGNNAVRIFNIGSVNPGINVNLSSLTLSNGKASLVSGAFPLGNGFWGGSILNNSASVMTVTNCTISGSTSTGPNPPAGGGGGIFNNGGGTVNVTDSNVLGNTADLGAGICGNSAGTVNLIRSTIGGNTATQGGAIFSIDAIVNVTNSTISGNISVTGGGIETTGDTVTVTSSTIARNAAAIDGGGIFDAGGGGMVNVKNTVVALNGTAAGSDVIGVFASHGHNLIGQNDLSSGFTNGVNSDQVGSSGTPLDPKLGPLQNNGGPTSTMALLPGSPAIDAGDDSVLGPPLFLTTDQRGAGFPRKVGPHVDIGAFEVQFDTCLKDNSSGNLFQFNSGNGQYKFTRCSDGFMISGTGVVRFVNGIATLTDSKPDRRVSAGFITSQRTGSATIYIMIAPGVWQTFRINSTNPNAVCSC